MKTGKDWQRDGREHTDYSLNDVLTNLYPTSGADIAYDRPIAPTRENMRALVAKHHRPRLPYQAGRRNCLRFARRAQEQVMDGWDQEGADGYVAFGVLSMTRNDVLVDGSAVTPSNQPTEANPLARHEICWAAVTVAGQTLVDFYEPQTQVWLEHPPEYAGSLDNFQMN